MALSHIDIPNIPQKTCGRLGVTVGRPPNNRMFYGIVCKEEEEAGGKVGEKFESCGRKEFCGGWVECGTFKRVLLGFSDMRWSWICREERERHKGMRREITWNRRRRVRGVGKQKERLKNRLEILESECRAKVGGVVQEVYEMCG